MPKNLKGYEGFATEKGKFVRAEDALAYAAERCGIRSIDTTAPDADEFKEMLVDWFFSGNWLKVNDDEEEYDE